MPLSELHIEAPPTGVVVGGAVPDEPASSQSSSPSSSASSSEWPVQPSQYAKESYVYGMWSEYGLVAEYLYILGQKQSGGVSSNVQAGLVISPHFISGRRDSQQQRVKEKNS